jgi:hypothetical protein
MLNSPSICFVHGLTGDSLSTWTALNLQEHKEVFWPKDFFVKDDKGFNDTQATPPRARILLYKYKTDVNSICYLSRKTLYHHAHFFLDDLVRVRVKDPDRPLIFIVHSFGGLLVKSALIFGRDVVRNEKKIERNIYLSTCGIISFGTPQTYAGNLSIKEMVGRLCSLPNDVRPETLKKKFSFEDFDAKGRWKADVEYLEERMELYKPIAMVIPELFCCESTPFPGVELVSYHSFVLKHGVSTLMILPDCSSCNIISTQEKRVCT